MGAHASAVGGPATVPLKGIRVVVGSIGDDIHVVGITILSHALRNAGAEVILLGIQTPPAEFVTTAVDEDADAVLVSSSNGHAAMFTESLRADFEERGATDVLLYVGGNLAVGADARWEDVDARFRTMGFDRAYPPRTKPAVVIEDLARDVRARGVRHGIA